MGVLKYDTKVVKIKKVPSRRDFNFFKIGKRVLKN